MAVNEIWEAEGASLRETGEGLDVKLPENSKGKRLLRSVVAAVCLALTFFPMGDLPAASAGPCRKARARRYVVVEERPVIMKEGCERYRPIKVRSCYKPCRRRIVRNYTYYGSPCSPIRSRPASVVVEGNCRKRVVYEEPEVIYEEPEVVYEKPRVVYEKPRVVYEKPEVVYEEEPEVVYMGASRIKAPDYGAEVVYVDPADDYPEDRGEDKDRRSSGPELGARRGAARSRMSRR